MEGCIKSINIDILCGTGIQYAQVHSCNFIHSMLGFKRMKNLYHLHCYFQLSY